MIILDDDLDHSIINMKPIIRSIRLFRIIIVLVSFSGVAVVVANDGDDDAVQNCQFEHHQLKKKQKKNSLWFFFFSRRIHQSDGRWTKEKRETKLFRIYFYTKTKKK